MSGNPGELPESGRLARRGLDDTATEEEQESDSGGAPEDINQGRRNIGPDPAPEPSPEPEPEAAPDTDPVSEPSAPEDINQGRRNDGSKSGSDGATGSGGDSGGGREPVNLAGPGRPGQKQSGSGTADESAAESASTPVTNEQGIESGNVRGIGEFERQQAAQEAEASIIDETEFLTSPEQLRITESGEVQLTKAGIEAQRAFQEESARESLIDQAIGERAELSDPSQVDVTNLQRTDEGSFTGDIELTESGAQAFREFRQESVDIMGTTGRTLQRQQAQVSQERQQDFFEADVSRNQFAQRQLARQIEREQGFQEGTIDINPTDTGDIEVGLTVGGQRRQLIQSAEEQGIPSEEVQVVNRDGGMGLEFTDSALRERAAAQTPGVSASDLQVSDERTFQSDAGLFAASSEDVPDETQRVIELTEDARRERLLEQAREEYPNAEDIDIIEEGGQFQAEITPESGTSRAVRFGEQFVDDPVGSTVEGGGDIVSDAAGGVVDLAEGGAQASADLVSDPVGTSVDVGESLVVATEDEIVDPTVDFAGDVGRVTGDVAETPAVQGAAAAAFPVAALEPTPAGELTLGGAAVIGTAAIGSALLIQRGQEALDNDPFVGIAEESGELPVQRSNQDVTELGVGETQTPELPVAEPAPTSELGVGETVLSSEIEVPAEDVVDEVGVPTIETAQVVGEFREQEGVEDPREITDEDIASPLGEPTQRGPSTRERQRRDDLNPFERTFPTGAGAVVGVESEAEELAEEAQQREVTDEFQESETDVATRQPTETVTGIGTDTLSGQLPVEDLDELTGVASAVQQSQAQRAAQLQVEDVIQQQGMSVESALQEQLVTQTEAVAPDVLFESVNSRGRGKRRKLRFDLDFPEADLGGFDEDGGEFQKVFESNVASPEEVLGVNENS